MQELAAAKRAISTCYCSAELQQRNMDALLAMLQHGPRIRTKACPCGLPRNVGWRTHCRFGVLNLIAKGFATRGRHQGSGVASFCFISSCPTLPHFLGCAQIHVIAILLHARPVCSSAVCKQACGTRTARSAQTSWVLRSAEPRRMRALQGSIVSKPEVLLGEGSYGCVLKGLQGGKPVAVKWARGDDDMKTALVSEFVTMVNLRADCPGIVKVSACILAISDAL